MEKIDPRLVPTADALADDPNFIPTELPSGVVTYMPKSTSDPEA